VLKDHLSSLSQSLQSTLSRHHDINASLSLTPLHHTSAVPGTRTTTAPVAVPPVDTAESPSDVLSPDHTLQSSLSQGAATVALPTPTGNSTQADSDYRTELRDDDPTPVPDSTGPGPLSRPALPPPPQTTVPSTEFQAKAAFIRSQFRRCHQLLNERETFLLKELETRFLRQQLTQLDFLRSLETIDSKVRAPFYLFSPHPPHPLSRCSQVSCWPHSFAPLQMMLSSVSDSPP
jgi:hypothetical protein